MIDWQCCRDARNPSSQFHANAQAIYARSDAQPQWISRYGYIAALLWFAIGDVATHFCIWVSMIRMYEKVPRIQPGDLAITLLESCFACNWKLLASKCNDLCYFRKCKDPFAPPRKSFLKRRSNRPNRNVFVPDFLPDEKKECRFTNFSCDALIRSFSLENSTLALGFGPLAGSGPASRW
jgi:hypothetical protein